MSKSFYLLSFLVFVTCVLSVSCSSSKRGASYRQNSYRVKQFQHSDIKLKPYKEVNLENGLKIYFIKDMALPRINLSLLVKVGQRDEDADSLGINYFTANLLEEGTAKYNSDQLADQLAKLGTDFSISPGTDFTYISIDGLTLSTEKIIELFSEILYSPSFKKIELQKLQKQVLTSIRKIQDNPSQLADFETNKIVFDKGPFKYPLFGDEKSIENIKRADIIKHFLMYYRPNNSYMAVTGALTDEIENKVIDTFKEWPLRTIEEKNIKNEFNQSSKRFFVMYKKDLVQSEIRVSMPLFARNHPDYLKMKIINEILGGGFVSRLNTKIRAQMGLTYSISSGTDYRKDLGTLDISTFTKTKSTFAMIEQIEKELQRLVQSGITKKELIASKNLLMGQFPRALETVDSLAFNLMYLDFNGIPFSYLTDYYKNLSKISVDDVNTAIKKYFDLGKVKYFILSDNKNRAQLKGLDPVVINP